MAEYILSGSEEPNCLAWASRHCVMSAPPGPAALKHRCKSGVEMCGLGVPPPSDAGSTRVCEGRASQYHGSSGLGTFLDSRGGMMGAHAAREWHDLLPFHSSF